MADFDRESMLEMFIFEMNQLVEQLEQTVVQSETEYNAEQINEIFRIMHTIKGSAAMMMFENIEKMAHSVEDLFFFLREESPVNVDYPKLSDHVLQGADFIKEELAKIQSGMTPDGDVSELIGHIKQFLKDLKHPGADAKPESKPKTKPQRVQEMAVVPDAAKTHKYRAKIIFENGCEMENVRAYTLVHNLGDLAEDIAHQPADVIDDEAIEAIRKNGFLVEFTSSAAYQTIYDHLMKTVYLHDMKLEEINDEPAIAAESNPVDAADHDTNGDFIDDDFDTDAKLNEPKVVTGTDEAAQKKKTGGLAQHVINVNVSKLDALLDLMSELVISEAMVTQNSELEGLQLDSFHKETRQLHKIIGNLQETIMSMRMVPLSSTFSKMNRIVRDMCRQLNKDVHLEIVGEETEVDKNIIEHISDPLIHIIRNSVDHGIETPDERRMFGKPEKGVVMLEAKNSGGDVLITIKDDGRGLDRAKILKKARDNDLLRKPESEYTEKEIHQFIFLPGFSTNSEVTAFSGRGVGMDVVTTNLEVVGGTVIVDSTPGEGSIFTLKIPSTVAIIEGMTVLVAGAMYTIPIVSIKKSFRVTKAENVFTDPNGNEMVTERNDIYNIVRLHEFFNIEGAVTNIEEGTLIKLENGDQVVCLLVDDLIGQKQVVVKPLPKYFKKVKGLNGCTLLGNGDISLIVDVAGFFDK